MSEKFSLKDQLFNEPRINALAVQIEAVYPAFDRAAFMRAVMQKLPELELKARISHISHCLQAHLPSDYAQALDIILAALPPPLDDSLHDNDFGDFIYAPYGEFVASYGCTAEHFERSMLALYAITQRFSVEYAIRPFLNAFPAPTLALLEQWATDPNYHVRRLCSEGTRPALPWAMKINIQPEQTLPILHQLHADKTRYVTRSVANHLNDWSKKSPDLLLQTLEDWGNAGLQKPAEWNFIRKHALRNLVKKGHPKALSVLGFGDAQGISLHELEYPTRVQMGQTLAFSALFECTQDKTLIVDYILYFQDKRGKMESRKVFKWSSFTLAAGEAKPLAKKHPLRENMTTRTLYTGTHRVDIQVNGSILAGFEFELEV